MTGGPIAAGAVGFDGVLTDAMQLREHYRAPSALVRAKVIDHLDDGCRRIVEASPFVLLATSGQDGRLDVSPRGGPTGFVRVLDAHRLAIPDLNGNNRLDSLTNVVERPYCGLLFVIPGRGETLRVNGRAYVTVDDAILDGFTSEVRRPVSAIGVVVEEAYIHCAKAFLRSGMWEPASWPDPTCAPSAAAVLREHVQLDTPVDALEAALAQGYAKDLAADRPQ